MMKNILLLGFFALVSWLASDAHGADVRLDDSYGDAFVNYQPYVVPGETEKPSEKKAAPKSAAPIKKDDARKEAPKEGKQKVTVEWLRDNYQMLEEKAVNDPTTENVSAYLYVKRITLDKAQRFQEKVMEVTNEDPLINENNRVPYASSGAQAIRNANRNAQEQAVRELAQVGGLLVFVDSTCRFCSMQMPVIQMLNREYGMEALVITLDGSSPKGFNGSVQRDNGLFRKLNLKLTPTIVYVHKPKGYANGNDTNEYRIVSQGFYALDELAKQIAFAGHKTKILSKETMRDLDVWDRGVASTEDMNNLMLDSSDPSSIKKAVEPLLLKQY